MHKSKTLLSSIPVIMLLCFFIVLPLRAHAQSGTATLRFGKGIGPPGSTGNPVAVVLYNQDDIVKGLQADICDDVNDFLLATGCGTTDRTDQFACSSLELPNGCVRIILQSPAGGLIQKGTGPVATLTYTVSPDAPQDACSDLTLENVTIADEKGIAIFGVVELTGSFCFKLCSADTDCDDEVYCTGRETCDEGSGICQRPTPIDCPDDGQFCNGTENCDEESEQCVSSGDPCDEGTDCNEGTDACTATPGCTVTITPQSETVFSGGTLSLSADTAGEECAPGDYEWLIEESEIASEIDDEGHYTAGRNTTGFPVIDNIKVVDHANGDRIALAFIIVEPEGLTPGCTVTITPQSETVFSGGTLSLSADTAGEECAPGDYEWLIEESEIASEIDDEGHYTAGRNTTGFPVIDNIKVVDHANGDRIALAFITVESEGISISPSTLLGFRWPWLHTLLIKGENAAFNLRSRISFEPGDDIVELFHWGFGDRMVAFIILHANPQQGPVEVTVSTGEDVVTGGLTIALPPSRR